MAALPRAGRAALRHAAAGALNVVSIAVGAAGIAAGLLTVLGMAEGVASALGWQ